MERRRRTGHNYSRQVQNNVNKPPKLRKLFQMETSSFLQERPIETSSKSISGAGANEEFKKAFITSMAQNQVEPPSRGDGLKLAGEGEGSGITLAGGGTHNILIKPKVGGYAGQGLKKKLIKKYKNKTILKEASESLERPGEEINPMAGRKLFKLAGMKEYVPKKERNFKITGIQMSKSLPGSKPFMVMPSQSGLGITLAGGRLDQELADHVITKVIPHLFNMLGIKKGLIPEPLIRKIVATGMMAGSGKKLSGKIMGVGKYVLPLLAHPFGGIEMVPENLKGRLNYKLGKGIAKSYCGHINNLCCQRGKPLMFKMSGSGGWEDFWSGFKKGFLGVFKAAAPIASAILPSLGPKGALASAGINAISKLE